MMQSTVVIPIIFLSTLSLRRATAYTMTTTICIVLFLSTLSLRRATCFRCCAISCITISIHALLAESDMRVPLNACVHFVFLSTLSLRRATLEAPARAFLFSYFYPRSPCGERLWADTSYNLLDIISIHALLAESDRSIGTLRTVSVNFYPRSPCGERPIQPTRRPENALFLSTLSLRRATL